MIHTPPTRPETTLRQLTLNALQFSQTTIKVRAVAAIHEVIQGTKKLNTQRKGAWSEFTKATPFVDC